MSRDVNNIKSDLGNARSQVVRFEGELRAALTEASGVKLGQIVISKKYGECRVVEIEPQSWGGVWLRVSPKKKDGTFGARIVCLFANDWDYADSGVGGVS